MQSVKFEPNGSNDVLLWARLVQPLIEFSNMQLSGIEVLDDGSGKRLSLILRGASRSSIMLWVAEGEFLTFSEESGLVASKGDDSSSSLNQGFSKTSK